MAHKARYLQCLRRTSSMQVRLADIEDDFSGWVVNVGEYPNGCIKAPLPECRDAPVPLLYQLCFSLDSKSRRDVTGLWASESDARRTMNNNTERWRGSQMSCRFGKGIHP
jgi:hypothetical protein